MNFEEQSCKLNLNFGTSAALSSALLEIQIKEDQ